MEQHEGHEEAARRRVHLSGLAEEEREEEEREEQGREAEPWHWRHG